MPMLEVAPEADLSTPSSSVPVAFRNVRCPSCGARRTYRLWELIRRRAPADPGVEPT